MLCRNCGMENDDKAYLCVQCGAALEEVRSSTPYDSQPDVPTYLVQAILVTIFCCMPFGVPAIVFAAMASSHLTAGNRAAALAASNNARTWCWVSFCCGLVVPVVWLLLVLGTAGSRHF